jgi:ADP-heptose:LPS heptosyltransferase
MNITARPWIKKTPPRRILAIRWQAMGDVVITLPYLQHLRNSLPPSVQLDLLTRQETEAIPKNIHLFNKVFSIGGARNFKKQLFYTSLLLPRLLLRHYDVVIDLQNNIVSETVRKILMPKAWSVFDKSSPIPAGERNRLTIEAVGLGENKMDTHFRLKDPARGAVLLKEHGWDERDRLVVINPAGAFETRNWSMANYTAFTRLWLQHFPDTCFVILGTPFIAGKTAFLKAQLGRQLIDLVDKTDPAEAFSVLQHASLVLSEDSGLMHMAWVSGRPTLTLFGSTRSDWARPLGAHSFFLDSSDLPCGNCMESVCKFGDVHCLTRFTPEMVFHHAMDLYQSNNQTR